MTDSKSIYQDTTGVDKDQYLVYVLYRDSNIPHYVGATKDSRRPYNKNHHARKDHDVTSVEIVQECMTLEDASILEDQMINHYGKSVDGGTLVNIQGGGHGLVTEETKLKMSLTRKGRPSTNKGKPMSDEQKDKIRQTLKGRPLSEETKQKMSLTRKGRPSPLKGRTISDEHRAKIKESWASKDSKGRTHSEETKLKMSLAKKEYWARRR